MRSSPYGAIAGAQTSVSGLLHANANAGKTETAPTARYAALLRPARQRGNRASRRTRLLEGIVWRRGSRAKRLGDTWNGDSRRLSACQKHTANKLGVPAGQTNQMPQAAFYSPRHQAPWGCLDQWPAPLSRPSKTGQQPLHASRSRQPNPASRVSLVAPPSALGTFRIGGLRRFPGRQKTDQQPLHASRSRQSECRKPRSIRCVAKHLGDVWNGGPR